MDKIIEVLKNKKITFELGVINNGYFFKLKSPFKDNVTINIKITRENKNKLNFDFVSKGIILGNVYENDFNGLYKTNIENVTILYSFVLKSHKQIPKCLLKRFVDKDILYCINTSNNSIFHSSASTYNRELGYYSMYFEKYLSYNYENGLGKLIKKIEPFVYDKEENLILEDIYNIIEKMFRMALFRNPRFIESVNSESLSSILIDGGYDGEHIAMMMEDMNHNFLKDMKIFIMTNKTSMGLITLKSMISNVSINGYQSMILPLDPKFAIMIVPEEYYKNRIGEYGVNSYMTVEDDKILLLLNKTIYEYAKYYKEDVIGNKKDLEEVLK